MNQRKSVKTEDYDPNAPEVVTPQQPPASQTFDMNEFSKDDDIGYFVVDGLPTKGLLYPDGTVIKARPMKVKEVKMLSGMDENNANDVVNVVLNSCLRGIQVGDLYTADKLYLVFWLRANTYKDSSYAIEFDCGKCKTKKAGYKFELDSLNIKGLDDKVNYNEELKLPSGNVLTFKLLTVKDESDNVDFMKKNENSLMDFDDEMVAICRSIDTIDGKQKGMIEKYIFLTDEILPDSYAYIESFLEEITIGLEPLITVECNKCGGKSDTALPFRPDFFLPKVRTSRNT